MKVKPAQIERFIKKPATEVAAILLYGPDRGLARERARQALLGIVEDPSDPFRVSELEAEAVRQAPSRLIEEAQALAFGGGRRVVRIRQATDALTPAFKALLGLDEIAAFVIIEAEELGPSSSLRRLFEGASNAAALPCYRDEAQGVSQLVRDVLREAGLGIEPDAMSFLQAHLGGDREVTRRELEKVLLYMADASTPVVRLEDVAAIVGDSSAIGADELVWAVLLGRVRDAHMLLDRLLHEGQAPVRLLRSLSGIIQRLLPLRLEVEAGRAAGVVIDQTKPPVHFRQKEPMRRVLERWPSQRLFDLLASTARAERLCKSTGSPDRLVVRQLVSEVAGLAAAPEGRNSGRGLVPGA